MTLEDLDQRREEIKDCLDWLGFKLNEPIGESEVKTARYLV